MVKMLKSLGYKAYKEIYLPVHMGEPDPCLVYMKPYGHTDLCVMVNNREHICDYMVHIDNKDFFANKNIGTLEEAQDANVVEAWLQLVHDVEVLTHAQD